jgi:KaiC/GvpD/RAD55 family RecA-like ATPase
MARLRSIADGLIIVRSDIQGSKIGRFLYIPKLKGARPSDRLVKFTVEDAGVQVDTRELIG